MNDDGSNGRQTRWGQAVSHDELVQMVIYLTGAVTSLNTALVKSMKGEVNEATDACEHAGEGIDKILAILAGKLPEANDGR